MHPAQHTQVFRRGFEQFVTINAAGFTCHMASGLPYSLDQICGTNVICLLLGSIAGTAEYDDGHVRPIMFRGDTLAYHPPGTRLRIDATEVRHGFIAFSYGESFRTILDDCPPLPDCTPNRENLHSDGVPPLAQYVRRRLLSGERLARSEMRSLAMLAYLETVRHLQTPPRGRSNRLSDGAFQRVSDYVRANIGKTINCADIAAAVDLPLHVVFEGVKARTGQSLYRFVIERRIEIALQLLEHSEMSLSEVASESGFSSQQHMTSTFTQRIGATPSSIRSTKRNG